MELNVLIVHLPNLCSYSLILSSRIVLFLRIISSFPLKFSTLFPFMPFMSDANDWYNLSISSSSFYF